MNEADYDWLQWRKMTKERSLSDYIKHNRHFDGLGMGDKYLEQWANNLEQRIKDLENIADANERAIRAMADGIEPEANDRCFLAFLVFKHFVPQKKKERIKMGRSKTKQIVILQKQLEELGTAYRKLLNTNIILAEQITAVPQLCRDYDAQIQKLKRELDEYHGGSAWIHHWMLAEKYRKPDVPKLIEQAKKNYLYTVKENEQLKKAIKAAIADLTPDANDPDVFVNPEKVRRHLKQALRGE